MLYMKRNFVSAVQQLLNQFRVQADKTKSTCDIELASSNLYQRLS